MNKDQTKHQLKKAIIETVKTEKPQNTQQLIQLMQKGHNIPPSETTKLLTELENENLLKFTKQQPTPTSLKAYMNSRNAAWFWTTITLATATTIAVFTITEDTPPITYLRSALGVLFVLFLPGYTFTKALFPQKAPTATNSEDMDTIERIALSIGMSLALTPIVGLILNYTPWGITLAPITLSLLALTVVFATAAILRENQTKTETANPS